MEKHVFYVYFCDAPGCGQEYATNTQPLSCPYCDRTALDEEYIYKLEFGTK